MQIAIGDTSMTDELKRLLMREEAVKRENSANLERAKNQLRIAETLQSLEQQMAHAPFAREMLRLQMIADMGAGGKIIVIDSSSPTAGAALLQHAIDEL